MLGEQILEILLEPKPANLNRFLIEMPKRQINICSQNRDADMTILWLRCAPFGVDHGAGSCHALASNMDQSAVAVSPSRTPFPGSSPC